MKKILFSGLLFLSPLLIFCQDTLSINLNDSAIHLQAAEVSSTRTKVKKEDLPQKVEIITAQEIKNTGARDLTDVLKKNAGIDVIQYQGMLSGIGIRGFRPQFSGINQRSLLLIDGRPAGTTNMATIDLVNVERIEVLKGPSSALYGSQAMGGVVNVITKKSTGEMQKSVYLSYGSFNTLEAGFNAGGTLDKKFDFDLSIRHFQQNDNYRQGNDNLFRNSNNWNEAKTTYYNHRYEIDSVRTIRDNKGDGEVREFTKYKYESGGLRLGYVISDTWRLDLSGDFFSADDVQNPGDIAYGNTAQGLKNPYRYSSNLSVTGNMRRNHALLVRTYTALDFYDNRNVIKGQIAPFITSSTKNNWSGIQIQDNIKIKTHTITIGIDNSKVSTAARSWNSITGAEKAPNAPNHGIYSTAAFANGHFSFLSGQFILSMGGRLDNITFDAKQTPYLETFKAAKASYSVFNPSAGIKYKLPYHFNIHTSGGQAFVTPDAYSVAGYSVSGPGALPSVAGKVNVTSGNPDLKPERSISFDAGFGYINRIKGMEADITYFNTVVSDRIVTGQTRFITKTELTDEGDTIASRTTYVNSDRCYMQGIEAVVSYNLAALADFSYSFKLFTSIVTYIRLKENIKDMKTEAGLYYTRKIHNVAHQTAIGGFEFANRAFKARFTNRYVGKRFDTDWNDHIKKPEIMYPSFMLIDFSTSFEVKTFGEITIQVNNITDENYYEKRGFNMPGRNLMMKYAHRF